MHRTTDVGKPLFPGPVAEPSSCIRSTRRNSAGKSTEVAAFEVVGRSGQLKLLNRTSALGSAACYLDVDATSKTVLVANYSTGSVASLPVQKDGSLGKASMFIQHAGSSVDPARPERPPRSLHRRQPGQPVRLRGRPGSRPGTGLPAGGGHCETVPGRQPFVRTPRAPARGIGGEAREIGLDANGRLHAAEHRHAADASDLG